MYFVIHAEDGEDGLALRKKHRQAHLCYLRAMAGRLLTAGPTLNRRLEPRGSLLVIDFSDMEEAKRFVEDDPYTKAGVFKKVEIMAYRQTLPDEVSEAQEGYRMDEEHGSFLRREDEGEH
ncbi:MAG: YciI family protein [Alphaproteobacteria bacterium GM7ARS4]|nr:YciI family protein [Alphaproteobacteria bacterium GM7ARS4]